MRDLVRCTVPGGELVQRLLVGPDVERIFRYREAVIERNLAGGEDPDRG